MPRTKLFALLAVLWFGGVAEAASYSSLVSQNYRTSALTRNAAGIPDWKVSKGSDVYFCKMAVAMAYVGRNGLVSITSSGREIKSNRAVWEAARVGPDPSLPQLGDLKAGRLRPQDVGSCSAF